MRKCPQCKGDRFEAGRVAHTLRIGEQDFTRPVEAELCVNCGEDYVSSAVLRSFERSVAVSLTETGAGDGAAFKFLRKSAGLPAAELAALLQVDPSTVSRWENGARFDRATWNTLCDLVLDAFAGRTDTRERLTASNQPVWRVTMFFGISGRVDGFGGASFEVPRLAHTFTRRQDETLEAAFA